MKTKTKLIVSITSLCLVVVAAVVSVVTVFALINNGINIGGSITFTAKNIYATVSAATLSGGTLEDADNKLQQIDYNATSDGSAALATWSDLNLTFPESGEDVTITFSVANNSTTEDIKVSIGTLTGTATNATMSLAITGEEEGTTSVVISKKAGEIAESAEFVITFHIIDRSDNASIEDFDIPLTIEEFKGHNVNIYFTFNDSTSGGTFYYKLYGQPEGMDEIDITRNVAVGSIDVWDTFNLTFYEGQTISFSLGDFVNSTSTQLLAEDEFISDPSGNGPPSERCNFLNYFITDGENSYALNGYDDGTITEDGPFTFTITKDTTITIIASYTIAPEL